MKEEEEKEGRGRRRGEMEEGKPLQEKNRFQTGTIPTPRKTSAKSIKGQVL